MTDEQKAYRERMVEFRKKNVDPFLCQDPEHCDQEHNEITGWESDPERMHHYGCGCDDCMLYYYIHLK